MPDNNSGDIEQEIEQLAGQLIKAGYVQSLIRTWVPIGVGAVLAWLAVHWHIVVSAGASTTVGITAAALVTAAYYALARAVEQKWPKVGRWLVALHLAPAPAYIDGEVVDASRKL